MPDLGQADWLWDDELKVHIPCCSAMVKGGHRRCHQGPLTGDEIKTGRCDNSGPLRHCTPPHYHHPAAPSGMHYEQPCMNSSCDTTGLELARG